MKKEYDFSNAKRGAVVPTPAGKTRITIRLDDDILEWFREQVHASGGGSYQSLINAALREHVEHERESLEETLRRVIREEIPEYGSRQTKRSRRPR
jgi:predicted solute-binding protein